MDGHKQKAGQALLMEKESQNPSPREQVLSFLHNHPEEPISEVAKIFGVGEKTIRAWKAHQTRGTYSLPKTDRRYSEQEHSLSPGKKAESRAKQIRMQKKANELDGKTWLRYSISVWNDIRKTREEIKLNHPAMFPTQLPKRLIEIFTNKNMKSILDPFVGTGSTLIAAMELNKQGIGFDISSEYIKICQERLKSLNLFSNNIPPKVYKDDARNLLNHLSENSVDLCITSPPYWDILSEKRTADYKETNDYEERKGNLSEIKSYHDFLEELSNIFQKVYLSLKPNTYCCVNVMDIRKKDRFYPLHSDVAGFMEKIGFIFDDIIIWDRRQEYNNLRPLGYPFVFRINKIHEFILIFKKPGK